MMDRPAVEGSLPVRTFQRCPPACWERTRSPGRGRPVDKGL